MGVSSLIGGLSARRLNYVLAVSCNHHIPPDGGTVRQRADRIAAELSATWQRRSARWIEESLQAAKGQIGPDQHQVRHWNSWHRFTALALAAMNDSGSMADPAKPTPTGLRPPGPTPTQSD